MSFHLKRGGQIERIFRHPPSATPEDFITDWRWPNFLPTEFQCRHSGLYLLVPDFLDKLQALRVAMGCPFRITSGYRDATHPVEARKRRPGAHATGRAVDIGLSGEEAFRMIGAAAGHGFTGLGINQKGGSRFIHLDDLDDASFHASRPMVWSY